MKNYYTQTYHENARAALNYENMKYGRFFNSKEECLSFYTTKHNLRIFYIIIFLYMLFAVLDCYSYYINFGDSYKLLGYLFFCYGIGLSGIFAFILFFNSDLIKPIGLIFLGTDILLALYFAYLPFIDDILLYRGVGGELFIRGNSIKYCIIILAVIFFYISTKKVINKFSFINEITSHNLMEERKRNKLNEIMNDSAKIIDKKRNLNTEYSNNQYGILSPIKRELIYLQYQNNIKGFQRPNIHIQDNKENANIIEPKAIEHDAANNEVLNLANPQEILNDSPKSNLSETSNKEIQNDNNKLPQHKAKKRKEVKTIDDVFNLYRSIMPLEEAKKIPFKDFFYDYIAKEYSEHDFIGYNFHLRYKEGQLFKIYKNGKEEPYAYKTLEQHFSTFCN